MDFQKVIAVATRRGIFQPAFDAYGGLAGFIDYGPVGVKMRRRIFRNMAEALRDRCRLFGIRWCIDWS